MNVRPPYPLLLLCLFFFILMSTGSILSPDSEIVYRVGEALADRMEFSLEHELEGWPGFGTAKGIDGKLYAVFGPLESIILAPCIKVANTINKTEWYRAVPTMIPMSYHIDRGLQRRYYFERASRVEQHAARFLVSFLNVVISTLCVYVLWRIVMKLLNDRIVALIVSILYAFGTILWNYSGSLFSEPLATLLVLISLNALVVIERDGGRLDQKTYDRSLLLSGFSLGLAIAAHLSAILFVPFFAAYGLWAVYAKKQDAISSARSLVFWCIGCGIVLLLLGYYNAARFGSFFETGRGVNPAAVKQFGYGEFVAPWEGLWGLLVSPSKGLFVYSPVLLPGLFVWRKFHKAFPGLSWMLMTTICFRLVFIAARSDWHGGFSLGPRYLLMLVPLCLLPAAVWLKDEFEHPRLLRFVGLAGASFIFICQQIYFCIGEVFSSYHLLTYYANTHGVNPFKGNDIYLSATYAPIIHLFEGWRGPVLLSQFHISDWGVCFIGFGIVTILIVAGMLSLPLGFSQKETTA